MTYKLGWVPDLPDSRDVYWKLPTAVPEIPYVNLGSLGIPIWDQGKLGSCTAQAIGFLDEFVMRKNDNRWKFTPARNFIYYEERVLLGTILIDSGARLRDGLKVLNKIGVCPEYMWPYSDGPVKFRLRPSQKCYDSAKLHKTIAYARVPQTEAAIKSVLIEGYPIAFGITVYKSFMSDKVAKTGIVTMPESDEEALGGHAIAMVGFDNSKRVYICRNSWSDKWGDRGYFYLPFDYVHDSNLADDFWTIYSTN